MSITLAHPFRLDSAGSARTIAQATPAHAVEVVHHVVGCRVGERPLAPLWGIADPLADGVDADDVRSAVDYCEPEVQLTYVDIVTRPDGTADIVVDAIWRSNA